jgi:hypothetical protein
MGYGFATIKPDPTRSHPYAGTALYLGWRTVCPRTLARSAEPPFSRDGRAGLVLDRRDAAEVAVFEAVAVTFEAAGRRELLLRPLRPRVTASPRVGARTRFTIGSRDGHQQRH